MKQRDCSLNIYPSLDKLTKRKIQISTIRDEKGVITIDNEEFKRIIRIYF